MVKIKGKIFKIGNTYAIRIRKALVDAEIFNLDDEYELVLIPKENINKGEANHKSQAMQLFLNPVRVRNKIFSTAMRL